MLRIALAVTLALCGCSKKADSDKPSEKQHKTDLGSHDVAKVDGAKVVVTLSVDWEGAYLSTDGLKAMQAFRAEWKDVPLTHFICPAYFTRGGDNKALSIQIREHVLPGDEVGLHLHSWFSLAKASGVTPRESPNFYGDDEPLSSLDNGDKGYEVALSAYSGDEITKLVATSLSLLEDNGLGRATSFRAGGYVGSPELLAAVRASNIIVDSSATWPEWFDASRRGGEDKDDDEDEDTRGLQFSELKKAWPNIEELTQPYGFDTKAGPLVEVPNSGSFPEYATADEMRGHLQRAMLASKAQDTTIYVNFGFHQESASEFADALSDTLFNFQEAYPGVIAFSTVSAVAKEATGQ